MTQQTRGSLPHVKHCTGIYCFVHHIADIVYIPRMHIPSEQNMAICTTLIAIQ